MKKFRKLAVAFVFVTAVPWAAEAANCPAIVQTQYSQFIRNNFGDGVKNYVAVVDLPANARGQQYKGWIEDPNNPELTIPCDCPNTHQDCDNQPYDHVHYSHALPLDGSIGGAQFQVTAAMALAFWDNAYDGYVKQGDLDVSMNCYGYAFGLNTYIGADPRTGKSVILGRCYDPTHLEMGDAELAFSGAGHAITIVDLQDCQLEAGHPPQKRIKKTSEKNRESPIYTLQGGCPGIELLSHIGPFENYHYQQPIQFAPYSLYKEKP